MKYNMEDKTYNAWDNCKELVDIFNKDYSCPYCGKTDDWLYLKVASGYGTHFSDSSFNCKECRFVLPITAFRLSKTPENHYIKMQAYDKGKYAYILMEHNDKVEALSYYKLQLDKYVGDKEDIDA